MKAKPKTVGELVQERGFCEAMVRVTELAMKLSRIPVLEWEYRFQSDSKWRFFMNGGKHDVWQPEAGIKVKRFEVWVEYNGWPAGMFNAAEGAMVNDFERRFLDAIRIEIDSVKP